MLYLTVPAFWIALTIALGTFIKSAAGIAGIGFAVILLPTLFAGFVPFVNEISPTSIGTWAIAAATGEPASALTLARLGGGHGHPADRREARLRPTGVLAASQAARHCRVSQPDGIRAGARPASLAERPCRATQVLHRLQIREAGTTLLEMCRLP